jgi:TonB-dependent receptor
VRWVGTETTSEGTILNPRHSKDKTSPDLVEAGCDVYAQKSTTLLATAPGEVDAVSGTVLDDDYYAYTNPTNNKKAYDVTLSCAKTYENDYDNWLPSMNLRYEFTDELVGRMALYRSMSRPDMKKIAPELSAKSDKSGEIGVARLGNPELKPTIADGIDLGLEWYFDKNGLLSVNYFRKDITDLIYTQYCSVSETSNCIPGIDNEQALGFNEVRRAENGTSGKIQGVEFNYQQFFAFLPAPFDGLGVQMGLTLLDTDAEYFSQTSGGEITLPMPNMSDESYNLQVYYERETWEVRMAYKYRSEYLRKLGLKDNVTPVFADEYGQWDLAANYSPRAWKGVSFTFEALNLTDEANVEYSAGQKELVTIRDYNGRRFQLGLVYRF